MTGLKREEILRNHAYFINTVSYIVLAAFLLLSTVFGVYWFYFRDLSISTDPAQWGVFGDYIGGTLNPILSFLTIILLAFTLILQLRQLSISSTQLELSHKELKLSRQELELTRAELKRTAEAQELSEKALRAQAEASNTNVKLAKINALFEYYTNEITARTNRPLTSKQVAEVNEFKRRRQMLRVFLDKQYEDLIEETNSKQ
jgi:CRISPR/Cas system CSM-associated protein Csm2 small subunit